MQRISILFTAAICLTVFSRIPLKAQSVSINTTGAVAHSSAMLDITSTNKGMLVPRMNTSQRTGIATPAPALLVYDTDTKSFWFYNSTSWSNLSAPATPSWLLTGNSGIDPASNFIGTTDNQPLRFRLNNLWAGELNSSRGNYFLGIRAGQSNIAGFSNIGLGTDALKLNVLGKNLVAIGDSALMNNGSGASLDYQGVYNTAIGSKALYSNITGNENTGIGTMALFSNITGVQNTANGSLALNKNTGHYNTAIGASALYLNTTGTGNTATGKYALYANNTGNNNLAIGMEALFINTTASNNVAIGVSALANQSFSNGGIAWNSNNVAIGNMALYTNNSTVNLNGTDNTAIGTGAMYGNATGYDNTAAGMNALYNNQNGYYNTAIGKDALINNTSGLANTATGVQALFKNNGTLNTAYGYQALYNNTTGGGNVAIGSGTLINLVGGTFNIAIGANSGTDAGSPNVTNTISIGNSGYLNAANNQVFIGNLSTTYCGAHVSWSILSDARIKTNIKEEVKGLDFIMRLKPVTYHKSIKAIAALTGNKESPDFPCKYDVEKVNYSGFLAQEVEKAANESGYDFSGIHKPNNSKELYALSYETFVVPLVKAMQEQQVIILDQQKQIDLLEKRLAAVEKKL